MREMKDSGIPWVGLIPQGWKTETGKNFMKCMDRPVKPSDGVITCFRDGEVTLRSKRREEGFTISFQEIGYQGIEPGDLVVHGMDGFAGAIGISDSRGKATPVLSVIDTNQDKRFMMYSLRNMAYNDVFLALSTGIRVRSCDTSWKKLRSLQYALPPVEEQKRIADCIEDKLRQADALIANQQAQIEKLKQYKQSLITEVVTKGLDPNAPMKDSGVGEIGWIPSHWDVRKTLFCLEMPITDGPHTTPILYDEGIPFVSAEAVSCGNGSIDFDHIRGYISKEFYDECCLKYVPRRDDIYMIKSGATTGRVSIVDTDRIFTIWSPLAVMRCNKSVILPKFLFYYLQSTCFQKQVELGWSYGTQQNIGMRTIEKLKVIVPSISEQASMIDLLESRCDRIKQLIEKKENKIAKLNQYKKTMIYEYVTGKKEVV